MSWPTAQGWIEDEAMPVPVGRVGASDQNLRMVAVARTPHNPPAHVHSCQVMCSDVSFSFCPCFPPPPSLGTLMDRDIPLT